MKVSVIVPTYKDVNALELILNALREQTYKNFEVIIAEDDDSQEVKDFVSSYESDYSVKHLTHEDVGNRKAIIMNRALSHAQGEYIVFIDGDTIPFCTFIESHVKLSQPHTVLCGRRVNLGAQVSDDLRSGVVSAKRLESRFFRSYFYITQGETRHYEQGIRLAPNSFLHRFLSSLNHNIHILGSNFSCFKDDIFAINGFDEDIVGGSKDDVDLEWRFMMSGCSLKSCKYCANLFHLHHKRASRKDEIAIANEQMRLNREKRKYICSNGIEKL
ncbi:MAG: glycosyltransferase [Campylobacterales bacterium]|nr:glycosyltransferase [Campylobacterales bacterium]